VILLTQAVLRLVPERAHGLELINNEGDMKVGFTKPFEPRMTKRFPAWLAASLIVHEALSAKYAAQGIRFLAASDDANQHLVEAPFDGRRSVMTRASNRPDDLLKLPVYAFYELLRLLGSRHATRVMVPADVLFPADDLLHLATVDDNCLGGLLVSYPDRSGPGDAGGRPWVVDYTVEDIPWPRINAVWFSISQHHTNPLHEARAGAQLMSENPEVIRRVRAAQELGVVSPIRSGLTVSKGVFRDSVDITPFSTALLWITPFSLDSPTAPTSLGVEVSYENAVLRWTPTSDPGFYSYEVFRIGFNGQPGLCLSPRPLRSALWVEEDTAVLPGTHVYGVRTATASGIYSAIVLAPPIQD
jgi:hypothetical protein